MDDSISRQAAIDALEGEIEVIGKANAEAVLKYTKMVCDRIKALPSAQSEPRWIPVEECLPDLGLVVWVTLALGVHDYNIVSKAKWDGDCWHYPEDHLRVTLKVLAWMPIQTPKPYERSEDEC